MPQRRSAAFVGLALATALALALLFVWVFMKVPTAQPEAGGLAQKIFYLHVPAAYAMYLSGGVCCIGSILYLVGASEARNAAARAGAECAVLFGALVLTSGPLWAKKAWGVYWVWDPRLTTLLLSVLVYVALVVLRRFSGDGEAERKFAAAFGILGTANLPIIHYSVRKWGGNHPTVVTQGGRGLGHPDMYTALYLGFFAMTLFAALILWSRASLALAEARLLRLEERASEDE